MKKGVVLLFLPFMMLLFSSCSKYYQFDEKYDQGEFTKAYQIINNVSDKDKNTIHYQIRNYRIIIRMALDGDVDYINLLKNMIKERPDNEELIPYYELGKNYILYLNSTLKEDYKRITINMKELSEFPEEFGYDAVKIRGISYFKTEEYTKAVDDLENIMKISRQLEILYYYGISQYYLNNFETAYENLIYVINNTDNLDYIGTSSFYLADIDFYQNENYREAFKHFVQVINYYPNVSDFTYLAGKSILKDKYDSLGKKFLKITLRIDKDNANAWYDLHVH